MSDNNNLKDVLAKHQQWLDGNGGERAKLRYADLRGANLRNAGVVVVGICSWHGCVTSTHVHIGCVRVAVDELLKRDADGTVGELHIDAERWWKIGRGVVLAAIEAVRTVSDE